VQVKVQGLEAQVQDLQQQLKKLEVERARDTAELDTLAEYVNCAGSATPQHAASPQSATPPPQSAVSPPRAEQRYYRQSTEHVRSMHYITLSSLHAATFRFPCTSSMCRAVIGSQAARRRRVFRQMQGQFHDVQKVRSVILACPASVR
jgi:hypothetical protein